MMSNDRYIMSGSAGISSFHEDHDSKFRVSPGVVIVVGLLLTISMMILEAVI